MDSDNDVPIKRIKIMNPYVQLNKAFIINSSPSIVKQFNNEITSDVKVILNEDMSSDLQESSTSTVLYLHKLVLTSGSPMFGAWLTNYSDKSKDAVLRIPENCSWMVDFFRYFYTGHITMTSENLVDIYTVADKYLVESLKCHCEEYIKESLKIKLEKFTCPHMTSVLTKPTETHVLCPEQYSIPQSNLSLRNRTVSNEHSLETNMFFRFNQSPTRNVNHRNFTTSQLNSSSLFNTNNPTNIFAKKNFESVDLISECTNLNSKMDIFCGKCNPCPFIVTRILASSTVANLAQMTCNPELTLLAKYNLMIILTEQLRLEDYTQFVQLSYDLLYDLLGDDNFYCSEFRLFCGLQHWIQINHAPKNVLGQVKPENTIESNTLDADTLLVLIRFPLMSAEDLYEVENSVKLSCHFSATSLRTLLHEAMRFMVFRNVHKAKADESWVGIQYKPRMPVEIIKLGLNSLS